MFPTEFKFGGHVYNIKVIDVLDAEDELNDTLDNGLVMHSKKKVRIKAQDRDVMGRVLLHELIHICNRFAGIGLDEDNTHRLDSTLYAMFKDNPQLIDGVFGE